jgi:V/A-type H+-transporting ATPase subunit D
VNPSSPGNRATRLELRSRLELARHAAELLHNKEEALRREQTRLRAHTSRTADRWKAALDEAAVWSNRVRALGGGGELATPAGGGTATIEISWQLSMGVRYPGEVRVVPGPAVLPTTTAALVPAAEAYREAAAAAAEHAASTAALQRVDDELAATRRRRRAIEQRLEPRLEEQLRRLDLALDEQDRDAALRTRLATRSAEASR